MKSFGFQSLQLYSAIDLLKRKLAFGDQVVLSFTGNIISSGLRELIVRLARDHKIAAIITNGAGLEEDIIKTFGSYQQTSFDIDAKELIKRKMYRIGNLAVSHELYDRFYEFLELNYDSVISNKDCDQTPGEIAKYLAILRSNHGSYLYWCAMNNIDVFCPTFHDGAFGDFFVEYREKFEDYRVDFLLENVKLTNKLKEATRCGCVILGGGSAKHFSLNNSVLRGGYDWSIVISTAIPFDGSDSGGDSGEAMTWGKLKLGGESVKVFSDATLVFPVLVQEGFYQENA